MKRIVQQKAIAIKISCITELPIGITMSCSCCLQVMQLLPPPGGRRRRFSSTLYFDLQNVTNRRNIFLLQYNQAKGIASPIYQIRFFPDILYRIQF